MPPPFVFLCFLCPLFLFLVLRLFYLYQFFKYQRKGKIITPHGFHLSCPLNVLSTACTLFQVIERIIRIKSFFNILIKKIDIFSCHIKGRMSKHLLKGKCISIVLYPPFSKCVSQSMYACLFDTSIFAILCKGKTQGISG